MIYIVYYCVIDLGADLQEKDFSIPDFVVKAIDAPVPTKITAAPVATVASVKTIPESVTESSEETKVNPEAAANNTSSEKPANI